MNAETTNEETTTIDTEYNGRWFDEQYKEEIGLIYVAVLLLLPWTITYAPTNIGGLLTLKFAFGEYRTLVGNNIVTALSPEIAEIRTTIGATQFQSDVAVYPSYLVWTTAFIIFTVLTIFTLYYVISSIERKQSIPIAKIIGITLTTVGGLILIQSILLITYGMPGYYIPIGGVFAIVMGGTLLTNKV